MEVRKAVVESLVVLVGAVVSVVDADAVDAVGRLLLQRRFHARQARRDLAFRIIDPGTGLLDLPGVRHERLDAVHVGPGLLGPAHLGHLEHPVAEGRLVQGVPPGDLVEQGHAFGGPVHPPVSHRQPVTGVDQVGVDGQRPFQRLDALGPLRRRPVVVQAHPGPALGQVFIQLQRLVQVNPGL